MSVSLPGPMVPQGSPISATSALPQTPPSPGGASYPLAGRVTQAAFGVTPLTPAQVAARNARLAAAVATNPGTKVISGTYDDFDNVIILNVEETDQNGKKENKTLYFEVTSLKITQGANATPLELVGAKTDAVMKNILGHMIKGFQEVDDVSHLTQGADPQNATTSNTTKTVTFTNNAIGFDEHNIDAFGQKTLSPRSVTKQVNNQQVLTDLLGTTHWQSMVDDVNNSTKTANHPFTFRSQVREMKAEDMHKLTHALLAQRSNGGNPSQASIYQTLPQYMGQLSSQITQLETNISLIEGQLTQQQNMGQNIDPQEIDYLAQNRQKLQYFKGIMAKGIAIATFIAKHNLDGQYFSKGQSSFGENLSEEWHDILQKFGLFEDFQKFYDLNKPTQDIFGFEYSLSKIQSDLQLLQSYLEQKLSSPPSTLPVVGRGVPYPQGHNSPNFGVERYSPYPFDSGTEGYGPFASHHQLGGPRFGSDTDPEVLATGSILGHNEGAFQPRLSPQDHPAWPSNFGSPYNYVVSEYGGDTFQSPFPLQDEITRPFSSDQVLGTQSSQRDMSPSGIKPVFNFGLRKVDLSKRPQELPALPTFDEAFYDEASRISTSTSLKPHQIFYLVVFKGLSLSEIEEDKDIYNQFFNTFPLTESDFNFGGAGSPPNSRELGSSDGTDASSSDTALHESRAGSLAPTPMNNNNSASQGQPLRVRTPQREARSQRGQSSNHSRVKEQKNSSQNSNLIQRVFNKRRIATDRRAVSKVSASHSREGDNSASVATNRRLQPGSVLGKDAPVTRATKGRLGEGSVSSIHRPRASGQQRELERRSSSPSSQSNNGRSIGIASGAVLRGEAAQLLGTKGETFVQ